MKVTRRCISTSTRVSARHPPGASELASVISGEPACLDSALRGPAHGASVWNDVEGQTGDCGCRISITSVGAEAPVCHLRCDNPPDPSLLHFYPIKRETRCAERLFFFFCMCVQAIAEVPLRVKFKKLS